MKTLLLRLAGPMQSWDSRRRLVTPERGKSVTFLASREYVDGAPTHTGIVGFLGCALGRERGSDMSDLNALDVVVRVDQPGRAHVEFRTKQDPRRKWPECFAEQVVHDAVFLVAVAGDAGLVEAAAAALLSPRWPLYLGKREYPPTPPIVLGVVDGGAEAAVREHPWIASQWWRERRAGSADLLVVRRLPIPRDDQSVRLDGVHVAMR